MKKVLIAIDYNPVSEKVAKAGYQLAQQLNAEVCLIHVVADASYYEISYPEFMGYTHTNPIADHTKMKNDTQKIGENYLNQTVTYLGDSSVKTHLAEGDTVDAILEYSASWGADILVLGTHSRNVMEKIFLGSVVASIIEKTKVPTYLIPVKN